MLGVFFGKAGGLNFFYDRINVIGDISDFNRVLRRVPDDILSIVACISRLPDTADIDDIFFFCRQIGQTLREIIVFDCLAVVTDDLKGMGMTDKAESFGYFFKNRLIILITIPK